MLGELSQGTLALDELHAAHGSEVVQAQGDGADAGTEVDAQPGVAHGGEGGEQHGVDIHAVAARGLVEQERAGKQAVRGDFGCYGRLLVAGSHRIWQRVKRLSTTLDPGSLFFRRLAYAGARYGPRFWVEYSPAVFGAAFAMLLPEQRQRVKENLRLVYGRRSTLAENRDVLRTFAAYASCLAEALGADRRDAQSARIRSQGEEYLDGALAAGRGLVIVTAHAGAWDCAGRFLSSRFDAPLMVVMEAEADDRAQALQDQVRRSGGVQVLVVGEDQLSALPLLRHLRAGGVAAFQLDRTAPSRRAIEVELFGQRFEVPEGPFRLAAMAGATLLPLFVRRAGYFDYELKVHPGIDLPRRPSRADLYEAASRSARAMEAFIRDNPTQWFHFRNG